MEIGNRTVRPGTIWSLGSPGYQMTGMSGFDARWQAWIQGYR